MNFQQALQGISFKLREASVMMQELSKDLIEASSLDLCPVLTPDDLCGFAVLLCSLAGTVAAIREKVDNGYVLMGQVDELTVDLS